ncbi:hypothetical protein BSL78_03861 [Apostichopus japonicus]|uniref:Uncharacterized protein n=1 Tax=Stichopus japonicus TaxID=307972 RepID=A0A2G8LG62_STIJA|nr:hypothetical protein BSL78_03861 [Apostichopus japonicus]
MSLAENDLHQISNEILIKNLLKELKEMQAQLIQRDNVTREKLAALTGTYDLNNYRKKRNADANSTTINEEAICYWNQCSNQLDILVPGTPGMAGSDGTPGIPGEIGPKGDKGFPGPRGYPGQRGDSTTIRGPKGQKGDRGKQGDDGITGMPGPRGSRGPKGHPGARGVIIIKAVYTRWGNNHCHHGAQLVYSGLIMLCIQKGRSGRTINGMNGLITNKRVFAMFVSLFNTGYAGGSAYNVEGGGVNYLCLPRDPQYSNTNPQTSSSRGRVYGSEYEIVSFPPFSGKDDGDVACAVCSVTGRSAVLMQPARSTCPHNWQREYHGFLMAAAHLYYRSEWVCVDRSATLTSSSSTSNSDGALFYPVETTVLPGLIVSMLMHVAAAAGYFHFLRTCHSASEEDPARIETSGHLTFTPSK